MKIKEIFSNPEIRVAVISELGTILCPLIMMVCVRLLKTLFLEAYYPQKKGGAA